MMTARASLPSFKTSLQEKPGDVTETLSIYYIQFMIHTIHQCIWLCLHTAAATSFLSALEGPEIRQEVKQQMSSHRMNSADQGLDE